MAICYDWCNYGYMSTDVLIKHEFSNLFASPNLSLLLVFVIKYTDSVDEVCSIHMETEVFYVFGFPAFLLCF